MDRKRISVISNLRFISAFCSIADKVLVIIIRITIIRIIIINIISSSSSNSIVINMHEVVTLSARRYID